MTPADTARLLLVGGAEADLPGEVLRRCGVELAGRMGAISDVLGMGPDLRLDVVVWLGVPPGEEHWLEPALQLMRMRPRTGLVLVPDRRDMVGPLEAAIMDRRERGQLRGVTAAAADAEGLVRGICRALADVGRGRIPAPAPGDLRQLRPPQRPAAAGEAVPRVPPSGPARGEIVTVFGAKGGVGKTTVAVALAAAAAASEPERAVLVDLDLEAADVAVHLDLLDAPDIIDILPRVPGGDLRLPRCRSAPLPVVPGPVRPELAEAVGPEAAEHLLAALVGAFRWVVVDVGSRLGDEVTYRAIARADRLVFVLTPDPSSIRTARLLIEHADGLGFDARRLVIVLNQAYPRSSLDPERITGFLGHPVHHVVPLDREAVDAAVLNGRPLVLDRPDHPVSRALRGVAVALGMTAEPAAGRRRLAGRFATWWREAFQWRA